MGKMAVGNNQAIELRWLEVSTRCNTTVSSLRGNYISVAQANYLLGAVVFAWPGWLCYNLLSWVVQAGTGISIFLYSIWSTPALKRVAVDLGACLTEEPPPTKREVDTKVRTLIGAPTPRFDPKELRELRDRLEEWQASEPDDALRKRIGWAIDSVDAAIPVE